MKEYKIAYGNVLKKIISELTGFFITTCLLIFAFFVVEAILLLLGYYCLVKYIAYFNPLIIKILFLIVLMFFLVLYIFIFFRKSQVILFRDYIQISRGWLYNNPFRDLRTRIKFSEIVSCEYYTIPHFGNRTSYRYTVWYYDYDNAVKITIKNGNSFIIPIVEIDDFIDVIEARMEKDNFFSNLNIDDLLKNKGLSYNDLNVRWKSKDEIDSIYYIDNTGNKVELIKY